MLGHRGSISNHCGLLVLSDSGDCKFCNLRFGDFQGFCNFGYQYSFVSKFDLQDTITMAQAHPPTWFPSSNSNLFSRYWAPGINMPIWSELSDATFRRYAVQTIYAYVFGVKSHFNLACLSEIRATAPTTNMEKPNSANWFPWSRTMFNLWLFFYLSCFYLLF